MTIERAIMPTARVTINGGSFAFVIIIPLMNPIAVEIRRAASTGIISGIAGSPLSVTIP